MSAERLQKYLARAGVASRRHAEELITAGRVAVNNTTVTELGSRVEPGTDLVSVDGKLVTPPDESSYFLLYKPVGVVTTLSDPQGRPTVANYLEETGKRLFPVGRLDYDAEGALLFTDDGALAHKLTHPSFQVPRTYLAKVKGEPDIMTLDKLRGGVRLEDGMATPVSVGVFESAEKNTWLKIVVAEGRPHLIKRLCAAVGHPVVRLFRPAYAGIGVEGLRPGSLRPLKKIEVELLNDVAEGKVAPPTPELRLPPRRHGRAAPGFNEADEDELSMDDDAPAPRKAAGERAARKAPARAGGAAGSAWKPVVDGGSGLARFGRERGAAAEGRGARRTGGDEDRPARRAPAAGGASRFGRSAAGGEGRPARKEWGAGGEDSPRSRGPRAEGDAGRGPAGRAPAAGGASRFGRPAAGGEGRPARKEWSAGGEDSPRPRRSAAEGEGRPARKEWSAGGESKPRFGGEGKPRFGGDSKPRFGGEGKGRFGDSKPRFGGEDKPRFGGASKPRFGGEDKPRFGGASKPRFGGEDKPRFGGAAKPRFGGEDKPRFGGASKPRFGGEDKPRFGGASKPRFGGEDKPRFGAGAARGAARPARGDADGESRPRFGGAASRGADRGESAGEGRPRFGAGASRGAGAGEGKPRFGGAASRGAGRGESAGEGRPRFGGAASRGAGAGEGRPRFGAGASRGAGEGRPRFGAGAGEGRPRFGAGAGEGRPRFGAGASRGVGRPAAGGEGRPARREWSGGDKGAPRGRSDRKPRDSERGAPRGRSGGFGAKPGGKGPRGAGGRSEERAWKPYDAKGAPRERVVRGGSRGLAPEGARKSEGFKGRAGSPSKGPRRPY